jgi:hypothetical protein
VSGGGGAVVPGLVGHRQLALGPQVSEQIKEFVGQLEDVDGVHPKMVFDPPWTLEMMSEDAKFALGFSFSYLPRINLEG